MLHSVVHNFAHLNEIVAGLWLVTAAQKKPELKANLHGDSTGIGRSDKNVEADAGEGFPFSRAPAWARGIQRSLAVISAVTDGVNQCRLAFLHLLDGTFEGGFEVVTLFEWAFSIPAH